MNKQRGTAYDELIKKVMVASKGYRPTAAEAVELLEPLVAQDAGGKPGKRSGRGRRARGGRGGGDGPPMGIVIGGIAAVVIGALAILLMQGDDPPPVDTSGTPGNAGAVPVTSTTPVAPPPPPPPPVKPPAEIAFTQAEAFAAANHGQWEAVAKRWTEVADAHGGTEWGARARENATAAEERRRQEAESAAREQERIEREARTLEARAALDAVLGRYDFAAAAKAAEPLLNKPGETVQEWRAKKRRIDFLAERFLPTFNDNVAGRSIEAAYIRESAGHDEVIKEADAEGVSTLASEYPRRIKWSDVKAETLYRFMSKHCVSTTDLEGMRFLAILAAETGLDKQSKEMRELAGLVASPDEVRAAFQDYFTD